MDSVRFSLCFLNHKIYYLACSIPGRSAAEAVGSTRTHTLTRHPCLIIHDTALHVGAPRPNQTAPLRPPRPRRYPATRTGSHSPPADPERTSLCSRACPYRTRTHSAPHWVLGRLKLVSPAGAAVFVSGRVVGGRLRKPIHGTYEPRHFGEKTIRMGAAWWDRNASDVRGTLPSSANCRNLLLACPYQ
jgi:hypothetical protein